ncbi:hypothetical protein L2E82_05812 [Cichorium intybus]|uniref:Uncharacterized protein n=1 Tax=Cichorium intybus TaxID=13427 RepID=A0ACB9H8V1_CICIN|nr:hypothetical protein L2E82_05812 [Cichorium intybus]
MWLCLAGISGRQLEEKCTSKDRLSLSLSRILSNTLFASHQRRYLAGTVFLRQHDSVQTFQDVYSFPFLILATESQSGTYGGGDGDLLSN